ncbi:cytochrome c oxidase accessory protein CcoG [Methylocystis iwaonis]|uniref:Cytochrome c oxidase accessory protein CcoG n=1 Tax=Methylocystis iwaonis TaxID=2885079 RepID=A0ABM8EBF8_9HYPH|nr:cytochrome c oxidase accessory protein CcoG [Methylocystis iwaonis]BDV35322.1 cytochrome c oxidase accessory protein CcoG [Methylocystis iwaonis]
MSSAETQSILLDDPIVEAPHKVYPKKVDGQFRRIKWGIQFATLAIYYFLPFVRWDRGLNAPSQAVLVDFPHRRFYFFFIEIWPQEVYYVTGLLILAALALFLMNAVAGRIWCGYMCPQTVWTDFYLTTERWIEGDARDRVTLDESPWTRDKIRKKVSKHFLWLLIAWWTGGAWVLYFTDAPTVVWKLATFRNGAFDTYLWIGILTFTTYVFAGVMREKLCLHACPWPRIQAALTDEYALNVTYRYDRGEPRMSLKQATAARAANLPSGDCVDCGQCVAVCPTGVDIRKGSQLGCIQCGLCIDACDAIMEKIHRPARLIGYDTEMNVKRRQCGESAIYKPFRVRTVLYVLLILGVAGFMSVTLATRDDMHVSVLHDRNPLAVRLKDGGVRNGYTLRFANKKAEARSFTIAVSGVAGAQLEIVGVTPGNKGKAVIEVGPDQTREARVLLSTHGAGGSKGQAPVTFTTTDAVSGEATQVTDVFIWP